MEVFSSIFSFIISHPAFSLWVLFYFLEKAVKLSPWKWDDILVDGIKWSLSKIPGLGKFLK